jgi:hypothetical protein
MLARRRAGRQLVADDMAAAPSSPGADGLSEEQVEFFVANNYIKVRRGQFSIALQLYTYTA